MWLWIKKKGNTVINEEVLRRVTLESSLLEINSKYKKSIQQTYTENELFAKTNNLRKC